MSDKLSKPKMQKILWDNQITLLDVRAAADIEASTFMRLSFKVPTILGLKKKKVNGQEKWFYDLYNPALEGKNSTKKTIKGEMGVIYLFEYEVTHDKGPFDTKEDAQKDMKERGNNKEFLLSPIAEDAIENG